MLSTGSLTGSERKSCRCSTVVVAIKRYSENVIKLIQIAETRVAESLSDLSRADTSKGSTLSAIVFNLLRSLARRCGSAGKYRDGVYVLVSRKVCRRHVASLSVAYRNTELLVEQVWNPVKSSS